MNPASLSLLENFIARDQSLGIFNSNVFYFFENFHQIRGQYIVTINSKYSTLEYKGDFTFQEILCLWYETLSSTDGDVCQIC